MTTSPSSSSSSSLCCLVRRIRRRRGSRRRRSRRARYSSKPLLRWSKRDSSLSATREGRGRRGGRGGRLVPPLFVAALVVDNDSGMLAMLVFLVMFPYALCSLRSSSGLRCSSSWPVCTRRIVARSSSILDRGICKACFIGFTPRSVFLGCRQARGQVGLDQKNNYVLGCFTGVDAPRAVLLFFVVRPKMLGIMAGMTQVNRGLEEYLQNWVLLGIDVICFRIQLVGSTVDT